MPPSKKDSLVVGSEGAHLQQKKRETSGPCISISRRDLFWGWMGTVCPSATAKFILPEPKADSFAALCQTEADVQGTSITARQTVVPILPSSTAHSSLSPDMCSSVWQNWGCQSLPQSRTALEMNRDITSLSTWAATIVASTWDTPGLLSTGSE